MDVLECHMLMAWMHSLVCYTESLEGDGAIHFDRLVEVQSYLDLVHATWSSRRFATHQE